MRVGTEHNKIRVTFGAKKNNNKLDQLANARKRGTIPDASPLQLQHGRQQSCRAAGHTLKLSVVFNSNSIITRILLMGLWSKDMSSLTWCFIVCKSEFQK